MASVQLSVILHKDYTIIRKDYSMIIKIKDFRIVEITSSRLESRKLSRKPEGTQGFLKISNQEAKLLQRNTHEEWYYLKRLLVENQRRIKDWSSIQGGALCDNS